MIKRVSILATLSLGVVLTGYSFDFKPAISLIGSYTLTQNYSHLNAGSFDISNRKLNYGLEVTQRFYLDDQFFFKTGIRYHRYCKKVIAHNQVPELSYPTPYNFSWERRYEAISVPIIFGRDFSTSKGMKGNYYVGFAPGILITSYADNITQHTFTREENFNYTILKAVFDNSKETPPFFFPTLDAGINFRPLRKIQGLSIGIICMLQLNKAQYTKHHAMVEVPMLGYDFFYDLYTESRIFNASVVLSYTFKG